MSIMIKCKMCGGDLILTESSTIAECEFCGTTQTVPTMDDDKKLAQFERAERLRKNCEFDKAAGVYESIVADFRQEAEAYWGLVLCKYGIEYVDDPATGKKIPTCHRSSFESVLDDPNFDLTLENADPTALQVYRREAKQIEEIRKGIIEVSNKEEPYDIFICYKETDADGNRTVDSLIGQDIYDALTDRGYRIFFSRITLEDKLGEAYEPCIFAALNSAKVMLAVGTSYEHYNAVWVKNEWSRYLKLMEKDNDKYLIPCYKGIDAYDMPKEFRHLQAQDLGKVGAIQDLVRGVEKLAGKNQKAAAAAGMTEEEKTVVVTMGKRQRTLYFVLAYIGAMGAWYMFAGNLLIFDFRYYFPILVSNGRVIQLVERAGGSYLWPSLLGWTYLWGIIRYFTHGIKNTCSAVLATVLLSGGIIATIVVLIMGMIPTVTWWFWLALAAVMALISFTSKKRK